MGNDIKSALLTVPEVAERLRCNAQTVYALIRDKKLGNIRVGRLLRVPEDELDKFIREQLGESSE